MIWRLDDEMILKSPNLQNGEMDILTFGEILQLWSVGFVGIVGNVGIENLFY